MDHASPPAQSKIPPMPLKTLANLAAIGTFCQSIIVADHPKRWRLYSILARSGSQTIIEEYNALQTGSIWHACRDRYLTIICQTAQKSLDFITGHRISNPVLSLLGLLLADVFIRPEHAFLCGGRLGAVLDDARADREIENFLPTLLIHAAPGRHGRGDH